MFVNPSTVHQAADALNALPWYAQLALTVAPLVVAGIAREKSRDKKRARVADAPPSVSQQKTNRARGR